ncbi:MAG: hypothetical protein IKL13_00295, partial [Clostridia bacterium]|nr:hypothetical protein [Clostridia bacterium]
CFEDGNIEYWTCEACGYAWLDAEGTLSTNLKAVILPMAHGEIAHVEAKDASCSELGNIEYWYCVECGQAWLDEACTLNTNLMAVKLPMADHSYTGDYDAICNVCGDSRDVIAPVEDCKNSVSEDVTGLAFKFDAKIEGMAIAEGCLYKMDFTNATYGGYKLVRMGAIASNEFGSSTNIEGTHLLSLDDGSISVAYRIINIPEQYHDALITMQPYFVIEIDGVETTVYGESYTCSYNLGWGN